MSRLWYIFQDNIEKGPFTNNEIIHYIQSSGIKADDLAWTEGLSYEERAAWSPLKLYLDKLGEVTAIDALDPDILLGEWQGKYEGVTIDYSFDVEEMEYSSPDFSNKVEYRIIPYFSVLNLEFKNIYSEEWEGYSQVEIIDQDTIIIRDFYLFDEFSDDDWHFYIEVTCSRIGG